MLKEIILPELGEGISEVEVSEIKVSSNQKIKKDDIIIIVETDKASVEVPSMYSGTVNEIFITVGDKLKLNHKILSLDTEESTSSANNEISNNDIEEPETQDEILIEQDNKIDYNDDKKLPIPEKPILSNSDTEKRSPLASPAIRKLARELGCNINNIIGSGPSERITKRDVLDYVNRRLNNNPENIGAKKIRDIISSEISKLKNDSPNINDSKTDDDFDSELWGATEALPINKIKKITGKRMTSSSQTIPQVTQFDYILIDELFDYYKAIKKKFRKKMKVSLVPFYIKALVEILKEMPTFNSSYNNDHILIKKYYNIGIAVDTPKGLIVPVIKEVDKLSIKEINIELNRLVTDAQEDKINIKDLQGSTFTISSLGGIGGTNFTPIVNPPEVAILGFSKAEYKFVEYENKMQKKLVLPISLTYDHRVIDGAEGVRFTSKYKNKLESFLLKKK